MKRFVPRLRALGHWLLEPTCAGRAAAPAPLLCADCARRSHRLPRHCRCCNHRLPDPALSHCQRCRSASPLNALFVERRYDGLNRELLLRAKFGRDARALAVLRAWLPALDEALPPATVLLPIPSSGRRLVQRGFNLAALLAKTLARRQQLPLNLRLLQRQERPPQSLQLGSPARRRNIRDAFYLTGPAPASVLLVDDVLTSGATLEEAARCLRAGGAGAVFALCLLGK